jgi:LuxR family quorum-sensing system transcriptional regulator CciR
MRDINANLELIRIDDAGSIRRAAEAFRDVSRGLYPFRIAVCHNIALNPAMVDENGHNLSSEVFGWDGKNDWWKSTNLALISPIPMACRYESEPFWINAEGINTRYPNHYLGTIDLSKFKDRARTHAAIVVPVHMPFGQIGAVSFNPEDPDKSDLSAEYEAFGDELGIYARAFIRSYVHIDPRAQLLPGKAKLSKREVECLRWAALGKTDVEISLIIGRSRATVRFHIHNASVKLDAINRSAAVFKATQLGYISNYN